MKKLNVAVIGCGYWGKNLVRNFHELGVLAAVCDVNIEAARHYADMYHVPALSTSEIWRNPDIQAVAIAVPADKHAEVIQQALIADKHVFVEKPLALNVADAVLCNQLARQHQRILMVGHLLQYHPAFLQLLEMVQAGEVGDLRYIYSNRLDFGKFFYPESAMWNFAPHDVSMVLSVVGHMPNTVYSQANSYLHPEVADITTTHLRFDQDIAAHIYVSWLNPYKEQRLTVIGSKAMLVFDDVQPWEDKLKIYTHQVNWVNQFPIAEKADALSIPIAPAEPLKLECQHFLDCVTLNKQPRTDGEEALSVLQVIEAAEESIRTGRSVGLAQLEVLDLPDQMQTVIPLSPTNTVEKRAIVSG